MGLFNLIFFFTKAMKFIVIEGPTYVSILMRKGKECQNPSHIKLNLGGYKMYIILVNFLLAHMVLEVKQCSDQKEKRPFSSTLIWWDILIVLHQIRTLVKQKK